MTSYGAAPRLGEISHGSGAPVVILTDELEVASRSATELIREMGCEARVVPPRLLLDGADARLHPTPDLLVSPLRVESWRLVDQAERLRQAASPRRLPILAVVEAHVDVTGELPDLRGAGVSGLVSLGAGASHFCMRIKRIVSPLSARAREARLPCFLPAQIVADSDCSSAVVVSLSPGGVRLAVPRPLEANSHLALQFTLPRSGSEVALEGRVTFVASSIDSLHGFEVGVAFLDTPGEVMDRLVEALAGMLREIES